MADPSGAAADREHREVRAAHRRRGVQGRRVHKLAILVQAVSRRHEPGAGDRHLVLPLLLLGRTGECLERAIEQADAEREWAQEISLPSFCSISGQRRG